MRVRGSESEVKTDLSGEQRTGSFDRITTCSSARRVRSESIFYERGPAGSVAVIGQRVQLGFGASWVISIDCLPLQPSAHLEPNSVIDGMRQRLLGPKVALGRLDGGMSQQQLDLFELPAGLAAQLRTGPAQVVGRQFSKLRLLRVAHDQSPDRLFIADLLAPE